MPFNCMNSALAHNKLEIMRFTNALLVYYTGTCIKSQQKYAKLIQLFTRAYIINNTVGLYKYM